MAGIGDIFDAAGDIAGGFIEGQGQFEAAGYYKQAADLTKLSTGIKEMQATRQIYQALGQGRSDIAASGLKNSGSAADVMRASAAQGSITRNLIGIQGRIEETGYMAQYSAAEAQGTASEVGGIFSGIGKLFGG